MTEIQEATFVSLIWENSFEKIVEHIEDGRDIAQHMRDFWKSYSILENQYAEKLKDLVDSNDAKFEANVFLKLFVQDKKETGTLAKAWESMRRTMVSRAHRHEKIAEQITKEVYEPCAGFLDKTESKVKQISSEGNKQVSLLQAKREEYKRCRKQYLVTVERASKMEKEIITSTMSYERKQKAESNLALLKSEAASAEKAYQDSVQSLRTFQTNFYGEIMPKLLTQLQEIEEQRVTLAKDALLKYSGIVHTSIPTACDTLVEDCETISAHEDMAIFVRDQLKQFAKRNSENAAAPKLPKFKKAEDASELSEEEDEQLKTKLASFKVNFQNEKKEQKEKKSDEEIKITEFEENETVSEGQWANNFVQSSGEPVNVVPRNEAPVVYSEQVPAHYQVPVAAHTHVPPVVPTPLATVATDHSLVSSNATVPVGHGVPIEKPKTPEPVKNMGSRIHRNTIAVVPDTSLNTPVDLGWFDEVANAGQSKKTPVKQQPVRKSSVSPIPESVDPSIVIEELSGNSSIKKDRFSPQPTFSDNSSVNSPSSTSSANSAANSPVVNAVPSNDVTKSPNLPPQAEAVPSTYLVDAAIMQQELDNLYRIASENDYYTMFEADPKASTDDIAKKRRELNRKYHPDQFVHDPQMQAQATKGLSVINEVWTHVLEKEATRTLYDKLCAYRAEYRNLLNADDQKVVYAATNLGLLLQSFKRSNMPSGIVQEVENVIRVIKLCRGVDPQPA